MLKMSSLRLNYILIKSTSGPAVGIEKGSKYPSSNKDKYR
jgi:hypothetical protein